jgi:hypothetical protein
MSSRSSIPARFHRISRWVSRDDLPSPRVPSNSSVLFLFLDSLSECRVWLEEGQQLPLDMCTFVGCYWLCHLTDDSGFCV